MFELSIMFRKYLQYLIFLLAGYFILLIVAPNKTVWLSLILGTLIGMFNLWILVRKTIKFSNLVAEGKTAKSLGTFTRIATSVMAVIIAMNYPEYFDIFPVVLGLMTIYVVIFIDFAIRILKEKSRK